MTEAITRPHGGRHYRSPAERPVNIYDHEEMKRLQAMDLCKKISWSHDVIGQAMDQLETPCLAFSGGKDSTVLLHLLRQHRRGLDMPVIYGNTTIEFPECVKFSRWLAREWQLDFHQAKPDVTFWWVVENYGWPLMGKTYGVGGVAHKSSREMFFDDLAARGQLNGKYAIQAQVPISSACCTFLKERPSQKVQKDLGVDGVFLGIMAAESRQRMFNFLRYGEWYFPKSQKVWKCHPLAIWTDDDIWAYIRAYDVPYAKLYDMGYHDDEGEWISHKRNGCMFCGMDIRFPNNHLAIMRRTHPKAWDVIIRKKGLGKVLWQLRWAMDDHQLDMFEQTMSLDQYLDQFPCVFDRM